MSAEIFEGARKVRRRRRESDSVAKTLAEWKNANNQVDSAKDGLKQNQRVPSKGSRKGCMRGKGGPENSVCNYRGVRQRTWGRWVAEIREPINRSHKPSRGNRLWLGTFNSAVEAALAYDEAARTMYGPYARVNFPSKYGMESQEVPNASSSVTNTKTWTPEPTVTPDSAASLSNFEVTVAGELKTNNCEICVDKPFCSENCVTEGSEMWTADSVRELEAVKCTPIIQNNSINDEEGMKRVKREEMKEELMDYTNLSNYYHFKDEHDYYQNVLMENIFEVEPMGEIKNNYPILGQEGFHGHLDSSALRQEQDHGFGHLDNFALRQEGNCDSAQLDTSMSKQEWNYNSCQLDYSPLRQEGNCDSNQLNNSMLKQEWNYYSCQLDNSVLRPEETCNSRQFGLSNNCHQEDGRPSDVSALRQEGNCDSNQLNNSMLKPEWNYYSCQLDNSALILEETCNYSRQFGLSNNCHQEDGRPSNLSYQPQNPDAKLLGSTSHMEEAVDYSLNSTRPDSALEEQGMPDLWFPESGFH